MRNGGAKARIAVIPGDGIGAEVTPEAVKVLKAVCAPASRTLEFVEFDWGADKFLREGVTLPLGAVEMLRDEFDAILFGALGDPRVLSNQHAADILLGLRFKLDLYVNARPVELLHDRLTPLRDRTEKDIRLIVFRENTEGLYVGVGGTFKQGTPDEIAVQEDVNSRKGVERIIRYAFEYARENGLKRVCMSDKSNAMTFAHGLWQRVFKEVRQEYTDIDSRHLFIDTLAMEIVRDPRQFDVIVTCNLFGDIISDLGAQQIGRAHLNSSHRTISYAVFCLKKKKNNHILHLPRRVVEELHRRLLHEKVLVADRTVHTNSDSRHADDDLTADPLNTPRTAVRYN